MIACSPRPLAEAYAHDFQARIAGVRDGDPESIHEARVATRRLREVLPLLLATAHPALATVRTAGRALGRVRDVDVLMDVLLRVEARTPTAACVAAVARQRLVSAQQRVRRKLIKQLDSLDLEELQTSVASNGYSTEWRARYMNPSAWAAPLRQRMRRRAAALGDAVYTAAGVYFPKRIHRVRIAAKKLRYAAEIARETGLWRCDILLRDLKRIQTSLGEIHDLQVVADMLSDFPTDGRLEGEFAATRSALSADIADRHLQYLGKRDRLLAAAKACERFATETPSAFRSFWTSNGARPLLLASAVMLPAVLSLRQRAWEQRERDDTKPLRIHSL